MASLQESHLMMVTAVSRLCKDLGDTIKRLVWRFLRNHVELMTVYTDASPVYFEDGGFAYDQEDEVFEYVSMQTGVRRDTLVGISISSDEDRALLLRGPQHARNCIHDLDADVYVA